MKLERRKVNALDEGIERFKKERLSESQDKVKTITDEVDNAHLCIEVPIIMASQLRDTNKNIKHMEDVYAENQKYIDDYKKDENENKKKSQKAIKDFVGKLDENFKDLYLKENNNYTVSCKGRKELRSLIEQCKENNIKYKWEKLIEGDYKYNVKFSLKED